MNSISIDTIIKMKETPLELTTTNPDGKKEVREVNMYKFLKAKWQQDLAANEMRDQLFDGLSVLVKYNCGTTEEAILAKK